MMKFKHIKIRTPKNLPVQAVRIKRKVYTKLNLLPKYSNGDDVFKIAIVQTGSWGDNINSTLMLKPIKEKHPNAIIDIYTSTTYGSAFDNNPLISNLYKFKSHDKQSAIHLTLTIPNEIKSCGYDKILAPHPMYNPGNWTSVKSPELGTNLICAWVRALELADIEYKLPLVTILELTQDEKDRVTRYIKTIGNFENSRNILMEVHGESGQTHFNQEWTKRVISHLLNDQTNIFISKKDIGQDLINIKSKNPNRIHFVNNLTIRECAELYNHCDIFLSVSSGLSNACNTNHCRTDIKWFEAINSHTVSSAPIRKNNKHFWYDKNLDGYISLLKQNNV